MKSKRARDAIEGETATRDELPEAPVKKRKRDGDSGEHGSKEKKSKKDKKHKQESRKERKEKRKDLLDLPEEDPEVDDEAPTTEAEAKPATKDADAQGDGAAVKEKKEKKDKKKKDDAKKEKKDKKDKKKSKDEAKSEPNGAQAEGADGEEGENPNDIDVDGADADADANKKPDRHIVFVGNLPFSATVATITAHFASLSPKSVRCLKNKGDDKPCRGIAFVEFGKVWHMRTCLDKFHHSMFDDGVSPPRRINVELTAGGGGKNKNRQDKIREKNKKLEENRGKRIEREKAAKNEGRQQADDQHMQDSIHPSRRGRVPGQNW